MIHQVKGLEKQSQELSKQSVQVSLFRTETRPSHKSMITVTQKQSDINTTITLEVQVWNWMSVER